MTTPDEHPTATAAKNDVILEARGIVKHYGQVVALDGADLTLRNGEVLGLVGDNGAGKSQLIKVLCGAVIPDAGQLFLNGRPVQFRSPLDARRLGIETVFQDLALASALDIASNIFLGREVRFKGALGWLRLLDKRMMTDAARQFMGQLKFHLPSIDSQVEALSGGQRQGVAVARAAYFATRVVIMDEPTAALGVSETAQVLDLIKRIRDDHGLPVIFISHNMPNVFDVADRIQVMRLGRRVALTTPKEHTMSEVVAFMTGATPGNVLREERGPAQTA
ncbi:MAG: ATP-binding cassette domain-containing protein [Roseiarcus sp.]